jgi:hypothetical protein
MDSIVNMNIMSDQLMPRRRADLDFTSQKIAEPLASERKAERLWRRNAEPEHPAVDHALGPILIGPERHAGNWHGFDRRARSFRVKPVELRVVIAPFRAP